MIGSGRRSLPKKYFFNQCPDVPVAGTPGIEEFTRHHRLRRLVQIRRFRPQRLKAGFEAEADIQIIEPGGGVIACQRPAYDLNRLGRGTAVIADSKRYDCPMTFGMLKLNMTRTVWALR